MSALLQFRHALPPTFKNLGFAIFLCASHPSKVVMLNPTIWATSAVVTIWTVLLGLSRVWTLILDFILSPSVWTVKGNYGRKRKRARCRCRRGPPRTFFKIL